MDPYVILGIDKTATPDEIDAAYREKAKKYHPDVGGDAWAFRQVQAAYDALTRETSRTERARRQPGADGSTKQGPAASGTASKEHGSSASEKSTGDRRSDAQSGRQAPQGGRQRPSAQPVDQGEPPRSEAPAATPRWWKDLLYKVISLLMVAGGVYDLWDSYDFLSAAESTQGWLTADPRLVSSGSSVNRRYETVVEYGFEVKGHLYKGHSSLSGEDASKYNDRWSRPPMLFPKGPQFGFPARNSSR